MEHTPQQIEEIKREYSNRRRRQLLFTAPFIVIIFTLAFTQDKGAGTVAGVSQGVWLPVLLALVAVFLVFSLRNWRCPSCSSYFGKIWNPRFCPRCGVPLRD